MARLIKLLILLLVVFFFACTDEEPEKELPRIVSTGNPMVDGLSTKITSSPNDHKLFAERAAAYYEMEGYDETLLIWQML